MEVYGVHAYSEGEKDRNVAIGERERRSLEPNPCLCILASDVLPLATILCIWKGVLTKNYAFAFKVTPVWNTLPNN